MNKKFFGKKVVKFGFVVFALALGLAACGDGGSTNGPSNNHEDTNISSVESEDDLPSCTESREGFVRFIDETKEGFICKDRKWVHYDMIADVEENLPGCTGSREGLSAYLYEEDRELNCVEGSWDVVGEVANSSSSEKGDSSSSREKDGSSSSVAPNSSSSVILSDSEGSSSSSAKSSSSVASSSSVTSSSSVASSSSSSVISGTDPGSSSSVAEKANWAYLNPNIDYGTMTDSRDGQVYKTVTIGTQTWMAENLNYDPGNVFGMGIYAWQGCYDNSAANCSKYGRLYTWEFAMDDASCAYGKACNAPLKPATPVRGVCPSGWHLPSHYEFEQLINLIDPDFGYNHTGDASSLKAGAFLRAQSGWYSSGNGTDAYGFSALPGGNRGGNGYFRDAGDNAGFWSSGEYSSSIAFYLYLYYNHEDAYLDLDYKNNAGSVRCLKD